MRDRSSMLATVLSALLSAGFGTAASAQVERGSATPETLAADPSATREWAPDEYGGCPSNPQQLCELDYPDRIATAFCAYNQCFEMSYAEEARLTTADDQGLFPRTWLAWHSGDFDASASTCVIEERGNKSKIHVPSEPPSCVATLETSEHLDHWLFASNPVAGCLGWIECREY